MTITEAAANGAAGRGIGDNQQPKLTYADILRVGPGTVAGQYLRTFWHPVLAGGDIAVGHVKPIRILGEDLTLYRGETGVAHVVAGRCAHRGVMLALGLVQGDNIECPYHGWKYDAAGQCIDQPSEPRPFCDRVKIKAYPTQEYLGLVFVYLGEGESPPMPRLADYEDDQLYVREIKSDIWPCSYFDLLENATDIAHTSHLHWHFGTQTSPKFEWGEADWGMMGRFERTTKKSEEESIYDRTYFHMPTGAEFALVQRVGFAGYYTRAWRIPRDDNSAIRFNLVVKPRYEAEALEAKAKEGKAGPRALADTQRAVQSAADVALGMIAGKEDMRDLKDRSETMNHFYLTNIQDCAVLASLGPPETRNFTEQLGGTDVSIALLRRMWLRELQAFSEGRPMKQWRRPDFLWDDITALHRKGAAEHKAAQ